MPFDAPATPTQEEFAALTARVDGFAPTEPVAPYDDTEVKADVEALAETLGGVQQRTTTLAQHSTETDQALVDMANRLKTIEDRTPGTSGTKVGLRSVVITEATDAAVQKGLKEWRNDFTGPYANSELIFDFTGTAYLTTPLEANLGNTQMQGVHWRGRGKRVTQLAWARTDVPMFNAFGLLRNYNIAHLSLRSTAPRDATTGHGNAKGWYLKSNQSPKNNTDGTFESVEWMGAWDYGLAFAGDANANENSEVTFYKIACSNDASFKTALHWFGAGGDAMQQNQFLNYSYRDTKLEHSHGDLIRMDYGGSLHCDGFNSWIPTGSACPGGIGADAAATRMIYLPRGYNYDSTMFMSLIGLRPELRSTKVKLLDSNWSGAGGISIDDMNMCALSSNVDPHEAITLRGDCPLLLTSSYMHGFVGLRGSAKPKIRTINVKSGGRGSGIDWSRIDGIDPAGIRKFDSASTANLKDL